MASCSSVYRYLTAPVSARWFSLFRLVFAATVALEVVHFIQFKDLFLLENPAFENVPAWKTVWLGSWIVVLGCLGIGISPRIAAILNYCSVLYFFNLQAPTAYHADFIYIVVSLFLIFVPHSKLPRLLTILRESKNAPSIMRGYYVVLVTAAIGLVYFDSALFKLESEFWLRGLGVWYPMTLASFTFHSWEPILNLQSLMVMMGYITLGFELFFIFLFWIPRLILPFILLGLALHLGIWLVFPIPLFGLVMCTLYVLLPPCSTKFVKSSLTETVGTHPTQAISSGEGIALTLVLVSLILLQGFISFAPASSLPSIRKALVSYAGLGRHPIFCEPHFYDMKSEYSLIFRRSDGVETWLPYTTPEGFIDRLGSGRQWTWWWIASHIKTDQQQIIDWQRFAQFWSRQSGIPLDPGSIIVKRRFIHKAVAWEENRQTLNIQEPWSDFLTLP